MIIILLSTFNGSRFLHEQLASLEAQTDPDWRLFWRDDGSTDNTVEIMQTFCIKTGRCERLIEPEGRVGPTASFLQMLQEAEFYLGPEDIVMFCDQDDVWLPNKISRAKSMLINVKNERPALYFSSQNIVEYDLSIIGLYPNIKFKPSFPDSLVQNIATGCTMGLNSAAVSIVNQIKSPSNTYHDWWCYIVVSACGGLCIYDEVPSIYYRQHSDNTVGARRNFFQRGLRAWRRGSAQFFGLLRQHIDILTQKESDKFLDKKARLFLKKIREKYDNKIYIIITMIRYNVGRQNMIETILLYIWLFLSDFPGG